jgi:hypothetical protein
MGLIPFDQANNAGGSAAIPTTHKPPKTKEKVPRKAIGKHGYRTSHETPPYGFPQNSDPAIQPLAIAL